MQSLIKALIKAYITKAKKKKKKQHESIKRFGNIKELN